MQQSSRTAEYMALFRAVESARGPKQTLFTDRWASEFLRPTLRSVAVLARVSRLNVAICRYLDLRWPGARPTGVARTRYLDDAVAEAIQGGIRQIVILGAGFDTRPYRIPGCEDCRIYEVDHPHTSRLKQTVVQRMLKHQPAHVVFVAADLNTRAVGDVLHDAGLDVSQPCLFLWEGVTNYLTESAVDATLRYVGTVAPFSRILFTYVDRDVLRPDSTFQGIHAVRALLRRVDEPWTFGFDPTQLPQYLNNRGLRLLSDVDCTALRARYMGHRESPSAGYEFYRLAVAEVGGPGRQPLHRRDVVEGEG
jgi:methyltransferase (TIGR00027 family)